MRYTVPPGTALSAAAFNVAAVLALTDFSSLRMGADPRPPLGGCLGAPGELDTVVAACDPDPDSALAPIAVAPIAPAATPAASSPTVSAVRLRFRVGGWLGTSFTMQVSFGRPIWQPLGWGLLPRWAARGHCHAMPASSARQVLLGDR